MVCGLLTRSTYIEFPKFISTYAGDVLWALLVFWLVHALVPKWQTKHVALVAIIFAFSIEFSQFYHAPWIDEIRSNKLGGLVLGFGFKFSDLICYLVGVALAAIIDISLVSRIKISQTEPEDQTPMALT